jgi:hypothetical protein
MSIGPITPVNTPGASTEARWLDDYTADTSLKMVILGLTPEAKRDLASQLLRSASTDEGYSEDAA